MPAVRVVFASSLLPVYLYRYSTRVAAWKNAMQPINDPTTLDRLLVASQKRGLGWFTIP